MSRIWRFNAKWWVDDIPSSPFSPNDGTQHQAFHARKVLTVFRVQPKKGEAIWRGATTSHQKASTIVYH